MSSKKQLWTPATSLWEPAQPVQSEPWAITADTTLIIVDMQIREFSKLTQEAFDFVFAGVLREIDEAMSVGAAVVILEFVGYGPTHPEIIARLAGYKGCEKPEPVLKRRWSGGEEAFDECRARGYSTRTMRLCGIFADNCVRSTALTLTEYTGVNVQVVVDACCHNSPRYDWGSYGARANLKLVRHNPAAQTARLSA